MIESFSPIKATLFSTYFLFKLEITWETVSVCQQKHDTTSSLFLGKRNSNFDKVTSRNNRNLQCYFWVTSKKAISIIMKQKKKLFEFNLSEKFNRKKGKQKNIMYVSEEFYFLSYRFPILIQFNVIFFQFFSHFVFVFQFILEIYFLSVSRFFFSLFRFNTVRCCTYVRVLFYGKHTFFRQIRFFFLVSIHILV